MDTISTLKISWRIDMNIFDNDFYKIYALDYILINDLNSLLLKKLRTEQGLIYDIESSFSLDEFQNNLSLYTFQTTVSSKNLLKVITAFLEVIDYLTKNKIKEENFRKYLETQEQFALERNENVDYTNNLTNYDIISRGQILLPGLKTEIMLILQEKKYQSIKKCFFN